MSHRSFAVLALASGSLLFFACSPSAGEPAGPPTAPPFLDGGSVGDDGGSPLVPPPPGADGAADAGGSGDDGGRAPSCGARIGTLCAEGQACATDADCASAVCGASGPAKGTCVLGRSCDGSPGADKSCGDAESCCEAPALPGGTFDNYNAIEDAHQNATISAFKLDKFEITVGRMRAFFRAMNGDLRDNPPAPGAGANPHVPNSGWRSSFDARLPASFDEINGRLGPACSVGGGTTFYGSSTWTPEPGPNEGKPITCVDWYTLFAFCAWDGGRLPTDAEFSFAAMGGDEQRKYAWGDDDPFFETSQNLLSSRLFDRTANNDLKFTEGPVYGGPDDGPAHIALVGRKTERGKWGHADLAGNVLEWMLDAAVFQSGDCRDCANVSWPDPPSQAGQPPPNWAVRDAQGNLIGDEFSAEVAVPDGQRFLRSSSWQGSDEAVFGDELNHPLRNVRNRHYYPVWRTYGSAGGRCAR